MTSGPCQRRPVPARMTNLYPLGTCRVSHRAATHRICQPTQRPLQLASYTACNCQTSSTCCSQIPVGSCQAQRQHKGRPPPARQPHRAIMTLRRRMRASCMRSIAHRDTAPQVDLSQATSHIADRWVGQSPEAPIHHQPVERHTAKQPAAWEAAAAGARLSLLRLQAAWPQHLLTLISVWATPHQCKHCKTQRRRRRGVRSGLGALHRRTPCHKTHAARHCTGLRTGLGTHACAISGI
jgi:hypothetical protein